MILLSAIVLFDLIGSIVTCTPTDVVRTTTGPIQGGIHKTAPNAVPYAAFKGIKYAQAPVGYLRFKPPVPVQPWTTTLQATTEGNVCPQLDSQTNVVIGSEDCLFLNVFTPVTNLGVTPRVLKSVMVWIHGGGFISGSGSTQLQRPDYLLEKDVIFVSLNYRLGVLGFLSLDHRNATGNAGLKDQNLGLKWVKANIAKFGGNPNSITIFGFSAGGASVGYHTISKVSEGLFNRAISMSGTPLAPWAFQTPLKAMALAQQHAKSLGTLSTNKETLLDTFYKATATQLVEAAIPIGWIITLAPTVENSRIATQPFLTKSPYQKYSTGDYQKVPEMLGFMDQETVTFTRFPPAFLEVITFSLEQAENIGIEPPESLTTIRDLIISGGTLGEVDEATIQAAINISTQIQFVSSIDRTQKFLAANNNGRSVYYYHVSSYTNRSLHNLPAPNIIQGAGHGDDLAYIFYIPSANYSTNLADPVARTISWVTAMWTNFAKIGNPIPFWPNSGVCGNALDIGNELSVGPRPINEDTALLESLSWAHERKSLGKPGLIRPNKRV